MIFCKILHNHMQQKKQEFHSPSALSTRGLGGTLKLADVHAWKRTKHRIEMNAIAILKLFCELPSLPSQSDAVSRWTYITLENKRRVVNEVKMLLRRQWWWKFDCFSLCARLQKRSMKYHALRANARNHLVLLGCKRINRFRVCVNDCRINVLFWYKQLFLRKDVKESGRKWCFSPS